MKPQVSVVTPANMPSRYQRMDVHVQIQGAPNCWTIAMAPPRHQSHPAREHGYADADGPPQQHAHHGHRSWRQASAYRIRCGGQYPLSHRHVRDNVIDEVRGAFGHAPSTATGQNFCPCTRTRPGARPD